MTDEEFVHDIYDSSYRRLVGQVFALCGDLATAEDTVQEAFVRAIDHARTFRRVDNPEAWLRRVAINIQRNRWRRMKRYALIQHRLVDLVEEASGPDLSADHLALQSALATLPESQRTVIVLHHLADLPVNEIATSLGVPAGTAKARLARGRAALAERLMDVDEEHHV
ncbi:MAG: RNA polymerase sigma factor [Nocardioidaceae bacterium]